MTDSPFKIFLHGALRIIAPDGTDVTPRSAKAKGLIALLATPAGRIMTRNALQEKLWSDRGWSQGRDSLKKELSTLRKTFATSNDNALVLNGMSVQLREKLVRVDVFEPELWADDSSPEIPVFMDGCDIRDPEFIGWLGKFRESLDTDETKKPERLSSVSVDAVNLRYKVALLPVIGPPNDLHCSMLGEMIADRIAITLRQLDVFEVVDYREPATQGALRGSDFSLRPRVMRLAGNFSLSLLAHDSKSKEIFWADNRIVALERLGVDEVASLVSQLLDQVISAILRKTRECDPDQRLATRHALDGIDMMFRLDKPDINKASRALRRAIEIEPRGPYLAFYAYHTLFRLEKSKGTDLGELREKADALVTRALEADPHNPITRALIAHIYSFMFRDFDRADSLIRPLASSPPDSPIYFHSLAALRLYTGKLTQARQAAKRARDMAQYNIYSYAFSTTTAMINTVDNKLDDAIVEGEEILAMHTNADRIYEPALRYLTAAYGLKGDDKRAVRTLKLIQKQSPGFALSSLDNPTYPVPSEITRDVLRRGIGKAFKALETVEGN